MGPLCYCERLYLYASFDLLRVILSPSLPLKHHFRVFIHESPRWLVSKGKVHEAREIIRSQLKVSGQLELMDDEFEEVLLHEYEVGSYCILLYH